MATVYKVLGQSAPSATTDTTLYTVPAATSAVTSTISIANRGSASATYRIAIRPAGASIATSHYIAYDSAITGNDGILLTIGITLATTDVVTVRASTADLTFSLFGSEIS
jgi:glucose-6-phosphate dehydrogenase assembly protein OpcA